MHIYLMTDLEAMACTPYNHLAHTGSFDVLAMKANGRKLGEIGSFAYTAAELGVRIIFLSCENARALIRAGAGRALQRAMKDPDYGRLAPLSPPFEVTTEFRQSNAGESPSPNPAKPVPKLFVEYLMSGVRLCPGRRFGYVLLRKTGF